MWATYVTLRRSEWAVGSFDERMESVQRKFWDSFRTRGVRSQLKSVAERFENQAEEAVAKSKKRKPKSTETHPTSLRYAKHAD
jgi:hypothetical protein